MWSPVFPRGCFRSNKVSWLSNCFSGRSISGICKATSKSSFSSSKSFNLQCVCVNLHWNIHLFKICNALYWNILKLVYIQVGVALLGAEPMHKEPRWRCWSARRAPSQVPVMSWNSRFHQDTKLKNTQRRIQHAFIRRIWWIALNSKLDKAPNLLSKNCQCVCRKNTMDRL
mgnify:CR=1 FL=1